MMTSQFNDILVHYGEIALKGKNRPQFVKALEQNIRTALDGLPLGGIRRLTGRLLVQAREGCTFDAGALARMRTVYGIANFAPVVRVEPTMEAMQVAGWQLVEHCTYDSFRVNARRAFKDQPYTSVEINEQVGSYILQRRPCKVLMKGAQQELHIEVLPEAAFLYTHKHPGAGGLPVGTTGRVVCLLSGGIDSPVAAARMQRRGCQVIFVHFHSYPFHTKASQEKVMVLAQHLTRYQGKGVLYLVPFGELQRTISVEAPSRLRVVLYRRLMMRIAAMIAARHKAKVLVTGESLGQVASQTLSNMVVIEDASPLPILRPMICMDKQEIIDQAMALGTYDTSIIPDQDCCTLFMPRDPETHAHLEDVVAAEASLDVDTLCKNVLEQVERQEIAPAWSSNALPSISPACHPTPPPMPMA